LCDSVQQSKRKQLGRSTCGAQRPYTNRRLKCRHTSPCSGSLRRAGESIKDGPKRLDAAKERFRKAGGELKAFYLVTGQYDAVAISEAPDDATVAKLALGNASMGFIRTETLRAFNEDEYRKIVGSLS
jgi:uncharacterized protein with GYD domain